MTVLVVWAQIAGQMVMATHTFGHPAACLEVKTSVVHQLEKEGATKINAICSQEPAL